MLRQGDVLSLQGHVGIASLAIILDHQSFTLVIQDMKYAFTSDQAASSTGERVFICEGGRYKLRLSTGTLKRTGTSLDIALLMIGVELLAHHRQSAIRGRPGWVGAPPDHFQRQGR